MFMGLEFLEVPTESRGPIEKYIGASEPVAKPK
jgi:hypothetical protein